MFKLLILLSSLMLLVGASNDKDMSCGDFCSLECGVDACDDANDCTVDLAIDSKGGYNKYSQTSVPRACEHLEVPPGTECTINRSDGQITGQCLYSVCRDVSSDSEHCGALQQPCQQGFECCGGECVDIWDEERHCGGCTTESKNNTCSDD